MLKFLRTGNFFRKNIPQQVKFASHTKYSPTFEEILRPQEVIFGCPIFNLKPREIGKYPFIELEPQEIIKGQPIYPVAGQKDLKLPRIQAHISTYFCNLIIEQKSNDWEPFFALGYSLVEKVIRPDILIVYNQRKAKHSFLNISSVFVVDVLYPTVPKPDRKKKLELYKKAGVKYNVLIDLTDNTYKILEITPTGFFNVELKVFKFYPKFKVELEDVF